MKKLAAAIVLAAVLPLAGCATPYGYSPGAWANYDGDYDYGYDGYGRPITHYGEAESGRPYGNGYFASQPSYGYAGQPYNSGYYGQPAYAGPSNAYVAPPNAYSTFYTCRCGY
jgi:hypothetical protein